MDPGESYFGIYRPVDRSDEPPGHLDRLGQERLEDVAYLKRSATGEK